MASRFHVVNLYTDDVGQRSAAHTSRGTEAIFCYGQTVRQFSDTAGRGGYLDSVLVSRR